MTTISTYRTATRDWNRPMLWLAAAMAVMTVVSVAGLLFDDRLLNGAPLWAKPFKFSVSVALYAVTWAWMTSLTTKAPRAMRWSSIGIVVFLSAEMAMIYGQVLRGKASHFNAETPFDATIFAAMGTTIAVVWMFTLVLTVLLMRSDIADPASRWAIRLGALIALIGAALGALMTGPTDAQLDALQAGQGLDAIGAHSVGVPDGGPGLPLLGWSTTGGDLRIGHFVGMHALQLLPLLALALGLLATRFQPLRSDRVRARLVLVAASGYAALVALVTWQALRGQSVVAPDAWTLAFFGAICAGVALGAAWAWQSAPKEDARELTAV